jgi:hypothetical protein
MSIRTSKLTVAVLLCVIFFLGWSCWHLYGQLVYASFIERQCVITQDMVDHPPDGFAPKGLAIRLDFFTGYCDYYNKSLVGSPIEWIVKRDYQQTLTNALVLFRSQTTNDLGSDPKNWIQKYEN